METLRYLLSKIFYLIPIIILFAFVYWIGGKLVPYIPKNTVISSATSSEDFLPAPGTWGKLQKPPEPTFAEVSFTSNSFNGSNAYGNTTYVSYDGKGNLIYTKGGVPTNTTTKTNQTTKQTFDIANSKYSKGLYLRNLSIYEGGHIYTGLTFTGEAKSTMFTNGSMPIIIIDTAGRVVSVERSNITGQLNTSSWVKFTARINGVIPFKGPCGLIFQAAPNSPNAYSKVFVSLPELCN